MIQPMDQQTAAVNLPQPMSVTNRRWLTAIRALWLVCLGLGSIGIYQRLAHGHLPAGYGSYVPWGLWIAIYFHGVGIAGGAFSVAALGYLFKLPGFRHPAALRVAIVIAFAAFIPAFLAVGLDLGHMERAHKILLSPSFSSMMAFNSWIYLVFLATAALIWRISYRNDSEWLRPLICLGVTLATIIPSQSGAFFGVVSHNAFWHSALMPVIFLASSITAGAAALLLIRGMIGFDSPAGTGDNDPAQYKRALGVLRNIVVAGIVTYFALEFAEISIVFWNPYSHETPLDLMLFGPYWWVFWIVHVGMGGVLALLLLTARRRRFWVAGGLVVAVTMLSARLNVLIPGQTVNEIKGLQEAFSHPRLSHTYHATLMEYLVALFLVAIGMMIYALGRRLSKAAAARYAQGKVTP